MVRENFGLAELGAADSKGAGGHLPLSDVDALVGLGVGPKPDPMASGEHRHCVDVAVEGVKIEDQNRSVQGKARTLLVDQMAVELLVVHDTTAVGAARGGDGVASAFRA